jgi:hypothetical protein
MKNCIILLIRKKLYLFEFLVKFSNYLKLIKIIFTNITTARVWFYD